ncbi:MAG: DUF2178 domain-containing protein [Clostridia bacterium]|nr:DUF2178 domain-containing protein [Clostridia bacterium]
MEFLKKLKVRFYTAIVFIVLGLVLIAVGLMNATEMASSFGLMFVVIGIARIIQYKRITKDEESLHQREVAENDERNVMVWTKARSLAFSIYIMITCCAIVVLYLMNMTSIAQIVAYNLFSFILIYWVCYFIISRKY